MLRYTIGFVYQDASGVITSYSIHYTKLYDYSVAGRIDSLAMLPAMNFGQALSTFVGQNIGANKIHRIRSGLIATLGMSSLVSIAITCIIILFRQQLVGLFTPDPDVIAVGSSYLIIVSSCYIVFSIMFSLTGVLRITSYNVCYTKLLRLAI